MSNVLVKNFITLIVNINVYNSLFHCCNRHRQLLHTYYLIPEPSYLKNLATVNLAAIRHTLLTQQPVCKQEGNKVSLNSAIYLRCLTQKECPLQLFSSRSLDSTAEHNCLHFEILNACLVSYHILINFVNTQWPDLFHKLPTVYQQINYIHILHAHRNASFIVHTWLLLLNGIRATTELGESHWNRQGSNNTTKDYQIT